MNEEKNIKNPAVMAELFELLYCTSGTVLESKAAMKAVGPDYRRGFF